MRKCIEFDIPEVELFKQKLIHYVSRQEVACIINSNGFPNALPNSNNAKVISFLAALKPIETLVFSLNNDPFDSLHEFWSAKKDWVFGHLSYDLKNKIEKLSSKHNDHIGFDEISFFVPGILIEINNNVCNIQYSEKISKDEVISIFSTINNINITSYTTPEIKIQRRFSKSEYLQKIKKIKEHIQKGDIYEVNFCQEFYAENCKIDTAQTYIALCKNSPAPFSCFYKQYEKIILSASPERFLKKEGQRIFSQPMKGTIQRGLNEEENKINKQKLSDSIKERSENIMIVDLVRNDLSKTALEGSTKVIELCKVYEFPQVFQMISTICSEIGLDSKFTDSIRSCFPMGSMTGAPKIRAMEIIEQYEEVKRGLFSGSIGYIDPSGNFDFNVIIRSVQYNASSKYLSFITGGAITILSDPLSEYEECLVKAEGILKSLNAKLIENV